VVHHYITSLQKGYDDFLVLEVATSVKEEESTWHQASDNLLSPN
jgi:hypothetical protein